MPFFLFSKKTVMEVYNTHHTYKKYSHLEVCSRINYYVHYNGVIAPSSIFYKNIIDPFQLRVRFYFSFEFSDSKLLINSAGEKPKRIRAIYTSFGIRGIERKTKELDVDNLQIYIKINDHLRAFEITDGQNNTTVFTFQPHYVLTNKSTSIFLEPSHITARTIHQIDRINNSFNLIYYLNVYTYKKREKRDLRMIEIINNLYNLHEDKLSEIRFHSQIL